MIVRTFAEREILPFVDGWERAGELPRELHLRAGEAGLLGAELPEAVGGGTTEILTGLAAKTLGYQRW